MIMIMHFCHVDGRQYIRKTPALVPRCLINKWYHPSFGQCSYQLLVHSSLDLSLSSQLLAEYANLELFL